MSLVAQYGVRLLKLRVTEAEIKSIIRCPPHKTVVVLIMIFIDCRLTPMGKNMHVRVFLSSDNTFTVTTHMYREIEEARSGEVLCFFILQGISPSLNPSIPQSLILSLSLCLSPLSLLSAHL